MSEASSSAVQGIAQRIAVARRVMFVTGAGILSESGLAAHRGIAGLLEDSTHAELPAELSLSVGTLRRRPDLCWSVIREMEDAYARATWNRVHELMADFQRWHDHVVIATENVEGFHQAAGSRHVIEVHGSLREVACLQCRWQGERPTLGSIDGSPKCPQCQGQLRPGIVLFGEALGAQQLGRLRHEVECGLDVVVVVGTSCASFWIHQLVREAGRRGALVVEINPCETPVTNVVTVHVRGRPLSSLEMLSQACAVDRAARPSTSPL